ncbi:MAG: HAD hydrolase-like protein [Woeseiaceae bacterium]|nr:HAD hydrolase-like protein [Woeseiaceae bacterium]
MHLYIDLDGTLTDPFEGISKCIRYALERLDGRDPGDDALRSCIGPPLQVTFRELLDESRAGAALALYRERFADVGWRENRPYDGIHAALEALCRDGHTLFVATTKPWTFAEKIVDHFGMADYFTKVYGSELDGTRVDKTELLRWALPQQSAGETAAMIGDRKHDMIGARNNGLQAVGVLYGYGTAAELTGAGAERLVDSPAGLRGALT